MWTIGDVQASYQPELWRRTVDIVAGLSVRKGYMIRCFPRSDGRPA
jgi:hypothetical protein